MSQDNVTYYQLNPFLASVVAGMFPTDGIGNSQLPVNPLLTGSDFAGQGLSGIRSLYNGSAGGTGFDISWAQDNQGNGAALSEISYIRVEVLGGKSEIDAFAAVPEPATLSLVLLGLATFGATRWRSRGP